MPVYEFSCNACGARLSLFFRSMNSEATGVCSRCGSSDLNRLFSKFAVLRNPYDPSKLDQRKLIEGLDENDPQSMARFLRRMNDEFQEEPDEQMEDMIGRLESGESVAKMMGIEDDYSDSHAGHDHGDVDDGGDDETF
jgi:putative FmdB family regulatory protein